MDRRNDLVFERDDALRFHFAVCRLGARRQSERLEVAVVRWDVGHHVLEREPDGDVAEQFVDGLGGAGLVVPANMVGCRADLRWRLHGGAQLVVAGAQALAVIDDQRGVPELHDGVRVGRAGQCCAMREVLADGRCGLATLAVRVLVRVDLVNHEVIEVFEVLDPVLDRLALLEEPLHTVVVHDHHVGRHLERFLSLVGISQRESELRCELLDVAAPRRHHQRLRTEHQQPFPVLAAGVVLQLRPGLADARVAEIERAGPAVQELDCALLVRPRRWRLAYCQFTCLGRGSRHR